MKKFNIETEKLLVNEWEERAEWINSTLKNSNDSNQNTDNASNYTEEIKIHFTYDDVKLDSVNSTVSQLIEVFIGDELVFVEKTNLNRGMIKTRSGIAGAANLLHGLLLGHRDARYYNDNHLLRQELQCRNNGSAYGANISKQLSFFAKVRLQVLNFKVNLFNILFK